jgi:2-oxoglutarate decarboxylase
MKSTAATYGGPGAPPPLTHGDIDAMATVRHSAIDPTLNPGAPWSIESHNTSVTAAANKDSAAKAATGVIAAPATGQTPVDPAATAAAAAAMPPAPADAKAASAAPAAPAAPFNPFAAAPAAAAAKAALV